MKHSAWAAAFMVFLAGAAVAGAAGVGDLKSGDPTARAAAARELGRQGDKSLVPQITPLLGDAVDYVVLAALVGLGDMGDPAAVPAVEAVLSHRNFAVRAAAMSQLGRMGGPRAAPKLAKIYKEPGFDNPHQAELIRIVAARTLVLCPDPETVKALVRTEIENPDVSDAVKEGLAAAAGATGDAKYMPMLKRLLNGEPVRPMCGAAVGLAYLGDNSGVTKIIERLPTIRDYNEARPIRDTLKRLTGQRMHRAKQWKSWWAKHQATFRAERPKT